jgi:hypothetical protein
MSWDGPIVARHLHETGFSRTSIEVSGHRDGLGLNEAQETTRADATMKPHPWKAEVREAYPAEAYWTATGGRRQT